MERTGQQGTDRDDVGLRALLSFSLARLRLATSSTRLQGVIEQQLTTTSIAIRRRLRVLEEYGHCTVVRPSKAKRSPDPSRNGNCYSAQTDS